LPRVILPSRSRLDIIVEHIHMSHTANTGLLGIIQDALKSLVFDRVDPLFTPVITVTPEGKVIRVSFPSVRSLLTKNPEKRAAVEILYLAGLAGCHIINVKPPVFVRAF
jgi:hypothetical protein